MDVFTEFTILPSLSAQIVEVMGFNSGQEKGFPYLSNAYNEANITWLSEKTSSKLSNLITKCQTRQRTAIKICLLIQ